MNCYELKPTNGRKSFYGKATVELLNGKKLLKSYNTEVALIDENGTFHRLWDGYSATTMNHVNSFLDSEGIDGGGKKWWIAQPVERFDWISFYIGKPTKAAC